MLPRLQIDTVKSTGGMEREKLKMMNPQRNKDCHAEDKTVAKSALWTQHNKANSCNGRPSKPRG